MNTPAEYEQARAKYFSAGSDTSVGFEQSKDPPMAGREAAPD
jgi:hypothetical protein